MAVGPPLPRQYAPLPRSEPKSRSESWQLTLHIPLPAAPAARSCLAPTRIFFGVEPVRALQSPSSPSGPLSVSPAHSPLAATTSLVQLNAHCTTPVRHRRAPPS